MPCCCLLLPIQHCLYCSVCNRVMAQALIDVSRTGVDPLEEAEVQGTLFALQQYSERTKCGTVFLVCFGVDPLQEAEVRGTLFAFQQYSEPKLGAVLNCVTWRGSARGGRGARYAVHISTVHE
jgi:hypothetical protein